MFAYLLQNPLFKGIVLLVMVTTFLLPFQTNVFAQDVGTACLDAERQAQSDISGGTWFAIGCCVGLIGYVIALQEPNPPATQLVGKSPEYVAMFTDCYRKKGKDIKSKNALTGCLVGYGALAVFYVVLFVVVASNDDLD